MTVAGGARAARRDACASSASACRRRWPTSRGARTRPTASSCTSPAASAPSPSRLPLSIGDGELAETADAVVLRARDLRLLAAGRAHHVGFLGAAQIDRYGNINSTVIGDYEQPHVAAARRRRRAGDRGIGGRGHRHPAPEPTRLRRAVRLPHVGRLRRRPGRPRAPRAARPGSDARDHRPRHPAAGPGHVRAGADLAAPWRDGRAGAGRDRLGHSCWCAAARHGSAHRGRAGGDPRGSWRRHEAFVYEALPGRVVFGVGTLDARWPEEVCRLGTSA